MGDTTTVKVHTSTRDMLLQLGAARRQSADQVIRAALEAMRRDERRQVAAEEARAVTVDPVDLAEVRAIQQDMAALTEGGREG
jgi:Arc/MetJ-type ribon-helix-helix transcriptional regulator